MRSVGSAVRTIFRSNLGERQEAKPCVSWSAQRTLQLIGWLLLALHNSLTPVPCPLSAAEKVYSVEQLNAEKDQWPQWLDQIIKVEGQVISFAGRNQFRLKHCELPFHLTDASQLRTVDVGQNVELTGRIRKESGKLLFLASRAKLLGSHLEQFAAREAKLKSAKPDDWYELAQWAAERGKLYEEEELLARGRRAFGKGLQLEQSALPAGDFQARLALAKKVHERQPDAALEGELTHEAARIKWQQAEKDGTQPEFLDWLAEQFPASEKPLAEFPSELNRRYAAHPLETYRQADEEGRDQLVRLLALEAQLSRIVPLAKADGSNAIEIAERLASLAPERTDLIEKYREQGLRWRMGSIASASRQEALRLADDLKKHGQPDEAKTLLSSWIRSQEAKVRKDDQVALLQLADDYLQLANDEPAAVRLLMAAHNLDPSVEEAGDRLKQLGYRWDHDRWIKSDTADSASGLGKSSHQLRAEMTADQVRKLLGKPTGITRVMNGKGVDEVWSFSQPGTPRLFVYFTSPGGKNSLKVERYLTEQR